jgi:hypothetical protein
LPFVSPSRDGKNQATKLETLPPRRDESGGLFIGTSMFLFALMNSAPAELLHPLFHDAALQLWIGPPRPIQIGGDGTKAHVARQKKRRHTYASVGILFTKNKSFLKENAAITD